MEADNDCLILEKAGQASFDVPESIEGIPPGFAYGIGLATGRRRYAVPGKLVLTGWSCSSP